ncbi:MAG: hypothetical protein ACTSWL_02790 [Promethearchaeota archaeon]
MGVQWGFVGELDNLLLNNYWRKFYTYKEIGWDDTSITHYLSQKEHSMQIASFNTTTVSFAASSRRNRFYEIYNRENMLEQDVIWGKAIEGIKKLADKYKICIVTARTEDLREKTLDVLTKLGFPMDLVTFYFKKSNESLSTFKQKCLNEIQKDFPTGVGVALSPNEVQLYNRAKYTPVAFTSIKNPEDFNNHTKIVCQNWDELCFSLQC